ATEQVCLGDVISIDWNAEENNLTFLKEAEGALLPVSAPPPDAAHDAAAAISDGREFSYPKPATAVAETKASSRVSPAPMNRIPAERAKNEKR
ncbi:MAG TPA: hypothetical protein VNE63_15285, partial [Candidatus Acidoferrales bacterium]|nr:hypothetical protein [Candidatus Acidoferrales bacterium]